MTKALGKFTNEGETRKLRNQVKVLSSRTRYFSKIFELAGAASKTSEEIDNAVVIAYGNIPPEELNGMLISDPINNPVLIRQAGKWNKIGSLLTMVSREANYTAESQQLVVMTGAHTVTLPSPTAGRVVGVLSANGTGAAPCTVKTPSGAILGVGVAASATSILLGTTGAHVTLQADGTNWHIIDGEQDSGWITITPSGTWENYIGLGYRLVGNLVRLRGATNKGTSGTTVFTLPVGYRPVQITVFLLGNVNGEVDFPGLCNLQPTTGVVYGYFSTPAAYSFDGLTFTVD